MRDNFRTVFAPASRNHNGNGMGRGFIVAVIAIFLFVLFLAFLSVEKHEQPQQIRSNDWHDDTLHFQPTD